MKVAVRLRYAPVGTWKVPEACSAIARWRAQRASERVQGCGATASARGAAQRDARLQEQRASQ